MLNGISKDGVKALTETFYNMVHNKFSFPLRTKNAETLGGVKAFWI